MPAKPGTRVKWYRCPVPREELSKLNKRSDVKGFAQTLGYLGVLAGTSALSIYALLHWPWWAWLPILYIHGTCWAFLINGFHELIHESVFKTKRLNHYFLWVFSFLGWHNHVWFWASHTEHHKYTLHPPDDLEVVLPQRHSITGFAKSAVANPWALWWQLKNLSRTASGRIKEERWTQHLFPASDPGLRKRYINWARFVLVGHAAIAVASLALGWWYIPIVITLAPFYGGALHFLCNNSQHAGLKDNTDDFRLCCRTIYLNPLLQFLYWHMNYHTEHHMYAAVPCYNLGKLHRIIKDDMPRCPRGLWATWRQIIAIQNRQKTDPSFQYVPQLPTPGPDAAPPTPLYESELRPAAV